METETTTDLTTINFSANHSLLLKLLAPHFSRRYGYVISFMDGDEKNKLKYEVEITFLKTIPEVARLFKIARVSSVYVNNAEPDLLIDQLVYETGKVFYPLIAEIDFDGKFIRIRNVEEIQTRWIKNREEILEYFTGEETEKYLGLMDEAIADEEYLNEVIANDMFISTYFSGIYRSYTWSLTVQENLSFPIAGKGRPVNFNVTATVAKQLNSFNAIELRHEGEANDERSALDIEEEQFFPLQKLEDPATNPGKQLLKLKVYPDQGKTKFDDGSYIDIEVRFFKDVNDPTIEFTSVLKFSLPKEAKDKGLPYFEVELPFTATVPNDHSERLLNAQVIKKDKQTEEKIIAAYNHARNLIEKLDAASLNKLTDERDHILADVFYYSPQQTQALMASTKDNLEPEAKVQPVADYQIVYYAGGKVVSLERRSDKGPILHSILNDGKPTREVIDFDWMLYLPKGSTEFRFF